VLTADELQAVTAWTRDAYGAPAASIAGEATRTTGLALRVRLQSLTMWMRAGGVVPRSVEMTEQEGLVAKELCTMGVPVAAPVHRVDGSFAGVLRLRGTDLATIGYVELRGRLLEKPSRAQADALGVALRKLHDAPLSDSARALPRVAPSVDIDARLSESAKWLTAGRGDRVRRWFF
jgi:aminoglycoside phosphotransferase (APT) family kinase protein